MSFISNNGAQAPRASPSQRQCRTPRRERGQFVGSVRGAAPQDAKVPIELQLQDASEFPVLPKDMTVAPRGRKARRSGSAWSDINEGMTPRARSLSKDPRERVSHEESTHVPQPERRSRAYSCDAGADAIADAEAEKAVPRAPRSGLKKPRESLDSVTCGAEKSMLAKLQQEMQEKMRQMAHLLGGGQHVGMQLNQMLAKLPTDLEAEAVALPVVQDAKPRPSFGADDTSEADAESVSPTRRRRLSNPRSAPLELPSGGSWEYPLTKEEKKARVVMIGEAEIDSLQDENDDLQELVSRLSIDQKP